MHPTSLARRLIAEGLGTAFLLAAIVGSGIMAERLSGGNVGIALLCNSLATGAMLVVLISIFGPVSGAHLNPAVTLAFLSQKVHQYSERQRLRRCQVAGGVLGTWAAHVMFGEAIFKSQPKHALSRGCGSRRSSPPSAWC